MKKPHSPVLCDVSCPVQRTAQVLDGKWTPLVLRDLLAGISPRLLAARLKALEQQGLVKRTASPWCDAASE